MLLFYSINCIFVNVEKIQISTRMLIITVDPYVKGKKFLLTYLHNKSWEARRGSSRL